MQRSLRPVRPHLEVSRQDNETLSANGNEEGGNMDQADDDVPGVAEEAEAQDPV